MKTFVILTRRADGAAMDITRLAKPEFLHVWRASADCMQYCALKPLCVCEGLLSS